TVHGRCGTAASAGGSATLKASSFVVWNGRYLGDGDFCFSSCAGAPRALHSLPTRRSADLLNLNGGSWGGGGNLHALVPSSSTAEFRSAYNRTTVISDNASTSVADPNLGGAQYEVFINDFGATLKVQPAGQATCPARLAKHR